MTERKQESRLHPSPGHATRERPGRSPVRKALLTAVGVMLTGVAIVGIVVPLLPATPFLLLAAACFLRGSERLHRWLTAHRWLGPDIRNYQEHRAITNRARVVALLLLWSTLGYTAFGVVSNLTLRGVLLVIGLGATLHMLRLNTATREMAAEKRGAEENPGQGRGPR